MKKIISTLVLFSSLIFGQTENSNQSIELPDFVITGVQSIAIPEMGKNPPGLFTILDDDFLKPISNPEELSINTKSNPINLEADLYNQDNSNAGLLKLRAGIYTLPDGDFYFNTGGDNILLRSHLWGINTTEYITNAGYNESGIEASTDFMINNSASFLPGLVISLNGKFFRNGYKLYRSGDPEMKRETDNSFLKFTVSNNNYKNFRFGIIGTANFLKFKENSFKEDLFDIGGFAELNFGVWGIEANADYKFQDVRFNFSGVDNYTFYSVTSLLTVTPSNGFSAKFGLYIADQDTNSVVLPNASFVVKLDKRISLFGEYSPHVKFVTINQILKNNPYFSFGFVDNSFTKLNSFSKFAIKYQYEKYFEIDLGASFSKNDNMLYFENTADKLNMSVKTVDDVKNFQAFLNLYFHGGPFGYFYGGVIYDYAKVTGGNHIPYYPAFTADLNYGYNFSFGLDLNANVTSYFESYVNLANTEKQKNYIDASLNLKYRLFDGLKLTLDLENILNKENYIFEGYREKSFDIIGGIEYRW